MIGIDKKEKSFFKIEDTNMKTQKILERNDLQEYIVNSWDVFTNEIGLPNIYYIGKEIIPHDSVKDRIDVLAFDTNDSNIVIIELKRDKEKTQLIQAISYAGMINTWSSEDIVSKLQEPDDEVIEFFKNNDMEFGIKIVLIAEYFDPEIILAADWLKVRHGIKINAYRIKFFNIDQKILVEIDQIYPLKELSDAYVARKGKQMQQETSSSKRSWSDIKSKLKYDFGENAIDLLINKFGQGDSGRSRFVTTLSKDEMNNIIINFRYKYVNIYSWVTNKENGINNIKKIFGENFIINEWQEGLSFNLTTEEEYTKFINWLNI